MRQQGSWSRRGSYDRSGTGAAHAGNVETEIGYAGQPLTARQTGSVGVAATTWTVQALPETINPGDLGKIVMEGGLSAAEAAPVGFYFGTQQRTEEGMEVAFDGFWYKCGKIYPTPLGGTNIMNYCVAVRGEPLS